MSRRFNERQRYWRENISQVSRIFLSLNKLYFDIFLGMILVSLTRYSHWSYRFLFIILFIYYWKKYDYRDIIKIVGLLLLFFGILLIPNSFEPTIKGEVKAVLSNGVQVRDYFIKVNSEDYQIGDVIQAELIQNDYPTHSNDGSFDEKYYLMSKGINFVVYPSSINVIGHQFHLRNLAIDFIEDNADERVKDIYLYLLLGHKTDGITDITQMAKEMAILHIFAISGMHFSILGEFIKKILTHFMSEKSADKIVLVIMGGYAICLEGNVAAWRAYFVLLFKQLGLKNAIHRFGLCGMVLLLCNPRLVFQTGFIYSMSLYFLVLVTQELKRSNLFVYLGSMIISVYFQYEIIPLGYLFGLLFNSIISTLFPLFVLDIIFNNCLSSFCFLLYEGMQLIMKIVSQYSFTLIMGQPPEFLMIAFYISYVYALYHFDIYKGKYYFVLPFICTLIMMVLPYIDPYGEVVMVDVGQGDCFLISLPYNKENILIDTGGLSYMDVATKKVIPLLKYKGIQKIDTVYISHQDFDHCGGLESLKADFNVEEVIEDFKTKQHNNITFTQLNPKVYDNENDNSLVIHTTIGGLDYLFTGDISSDVEKDIIALFPSLDIDVLKVGHHGSSTSSSNELLEVTTPKLSLISVGKNNIYGHPTSAVLNRLKAYGSYILRTDRQGTQMIYFKDNQSFIEIME